MKKAKVTRGKLAKNAYDDDGDGSGWLTERALFTGFGYSEGSVGSSLNYEEFVYFVQCSLLDSRKTKV